MDCYVYYIFFFNKHDKILILNFLLGRVLVTTQVEVLIKVQVKVQVNVQVQVNVKVDIEVYVQVLFISKLKLQCQ